LNIQSASSMGVKGVVKQTKWGKKRNKPEIPTFFAFFVLYVFLLPSQLYL